ncbi:uncharacterized protein GLRG_07759 [Colletotrichum graminicola M1.001]|uniref:Uncharacterized protein n=1 Tax=Colletotrichum graminicola (strain M1.001 / M2 / FGSC 10212) TaxID=645133 RepID=E3QNK2_COLGM|nr:uncharacterized protein GLRG_07759 [Colletotrichum graminicola M1.001]EFQ32489.1 hypothetical protein GLRG_07759 [Colletotrichum graminicola M1.001]
MGLESDVAPGGLVITMSKPLPPRPSDERSLLLPLDDPGPDPSDLVLFRRAVGINVRYDDGGDADDAALESSRAAPLGIYAAAIRRPPPPPGPPHRHRDDISALRI